MNDYDKILSLQAKLIESETKSFLYQWITSELQSRPLGRWIFQRTISRITGEQRKKIRRGAKSN